MLLWCVVWYYSLVVCLFCFFFIRPTPFKDGIVHGVERREEGWREGRKAGKKKVRHRSRMDCNGSCFANGQVGAYVERPNEAKLNDLGNNTGCRLSPPGQFEKLGGT